jgi:hypothetical protein
VSRHLADLEAPRVVAPGQQGTVTAKVGPGVTDAALYVGGPDGKAERHGELRASVGGAAGNTVIEVVGTFEGRRTVLARAVVAVGEAPAEFPAKPPEDATPIKTSADATAALQKVLEKVHGGAVAADAAAEAVAKAEAAGRVADEPAGPATPPAGVELMSLRVPGADLQLALGVLEQSPFLRESATWHRITPAAAKAAKGGDMGLAFAVSGGGSSPEPSPATPPPPKPQEPGSATP